MKKEKVIIELSMDDGDIAINIKMDPPMKNVNSMTDLQALALNMVQHAKEMLEPSEKESEGAE